MANLLTGFIERLLLRRSELSGIRVAATAQLTPHMLRIEFEGANLARFDTRDDLHVRLALPPEGQPRASWLRIGRDGTATIRDRNVRPVYRKYTIRSVDPAAGRLAVDFVIHADGGPGSGWAASAKPGDVLGMIGPGGRGVPASDWLLLAGDETALPAIGRILEELPARARGAVFVEVQDAAEEQPLRVPPGMTLQWLHRGAAAPGTTSLLVDAVSATALPQASGRFVWAAAEDAAIRTLRARLKSFGLRQKEEFLAVAYWKRERPAP